MKYTPYMGIDISLENKFLIMYYNIREDAKHHFVTEETPEAFSR